MSIHVNFAGHNNLLSSLTQVICNYRWDFVRVELVGNVITSCDSDKCSQSAHNKMKQLNYMMLVNVDWCGEALCYTYSQRTFNNVKAEVGLGLKSHQDKNNFHLNNSFKHLQNYNYKNLTILDQLITIFQHFSAIDRSH